MQSNPDLERMIDAALPGYSSAEPRPGLEERVLARALDAKPRVPRISWQLWFAVPAFAVLLIFLILPRTHHQPLRPIQSSSANLPTTVRSAPETIAAPHVVPTAKKAHPRLSPTVLAAEPRSLPRLEVFPSPSPLTAEEQTLVAYSRAQFQALQTKPNTDVEIDPIYLAELEIEPLTIPALNTPASSQSESGRNDQKP
jgi:hypothetical protein